MTSTSQPVILVPNAPVNDDLWDWIKNHPIMTGIIICVIIIVISSIMASIIVNMSKTTIKQAPPPPPPDELLNPLPTKVISQTNPLAVKTVTPPSTPRAITAADSAYHSQETAKAQSVIALQDVSKQSAARPTHEGTTSTDATVAITTDAIKAQPVTGRFSGKFNAFSFLTIYQNGDVAYSATGTSWKKQQNVNFTVTSGDVLIFMVQNAGNYGGLIGEFTWNGVTYYTNTTLFSTTQYVAEQGNALSNSTQGTIATPDDWSSPAPSKAVIVPAANWISGVNASTLYPKSSWIWEENKCSSCYVRFVWTAPGNLSTAAQAVTQKQIADPLYKVYPGGMSLNAYFIASDFLSVFINNDLVYTDPSLTSGQIQNFNMTVYVGDKIDFVVQNIAGHKNSLNGNFTIGKTSYYTGTANSPLVNCYTVEKNFTAGTYGTIPTSYPIPGLTQDTCVIGPHLDIMPGSNPISPSLGLKSGYTVYTMTLTGGTSGFVGAVNAVTPGLLTKFTQLKNKFLVKANHGKATQANNTSNANIAQPTTHEGFTNKPRSYFRSCNLKYS